MFNQLFWRYVMRVFSKESKDAFRDKRTMRLAFLPAFYFVGMFCAGVLFVVNIQTCSDVNVLHPVSLAVSGAQHMPELINWLTEQGAPIKTIYADAYQQVENNSLDYALIIPESAA